MKYKIKNGQFTGSHNVRITPEFHREPDVEKLGRALIAVAMRMAEKKKAAESELVNGETPLDVPNMTNSNASAEKEDGMT